MDLSKAIDIFVRQSIEEIEDTLGMGFLSFSHTPEVINTFKNRLVYTVKSIAPIIREKYSRYYLYATIDGNSYSSNIDLISCKNLTPIIYSVLAKYKKRVIKPSFKYIRGFKCGT